MNYISVCSGIEAATVAWHSLGWTPQAFSEIEPFPCKVLAYHYPTVPNLGDMTKFKEWPDYANIDVLVGGTPCQSFSIAGLRKGLDDPRGNLMLTYLAIADKYRPTWVVWENVPGVLSSNGGRDFGTFLGALGKLGYGFAYRVLDAQYVRTDGYPHAVPQRRRRVFVVGCLGDAGRAAAVLFDSESLRGNPPPRREAGKGFTHPVAPCLTSSGRGVDRAGDTRGQDAVIAVGGNVSHTLKGEGCDASEDGTGRGTPVIAFDTTQITSKANFSNPQPGDPCHPLARGAHALTICMSTGQAGAEIGIGIGTTLNCNHEAPITCLPINTQIALRSEALGESTGFGIGEDGSAAYTLQAAHHHAVAYRTNSAGQVNAQDGISAALNTQTDPCAQIVAYDMRGRDGGSQLEGPHDTANIRAASGGSSRSYVQSPMQVRRLMPVECERLQGFYDNYTNIPGASDAARYKALGNSMAVNVMQLIGQRIQMVSEIPTSSESEE